MAAPTPAQIKQCKVLVTLDADTAHGLLALSEDGRRVTWTDTEQRLPDNPKRFTQDPSVLGREGFTSGRHYWELQLLRDGGWIVGVARESVSRKGMVNNSPEGGVWAVDRYINQYEALTTPRSLLTPSQRPVKLGVYLDYDGGRMSVYNADTMEELYTFTGTAFTGQIYPYVYFYRWTDLRVV